MSFIVSHRHVEVIHALRGTGFEGLNMKYDINNFNKLMPFLETEISSNKSIIAKSNNFFYATFFFLLSGLPQSHYVKSP